MTEGERLLGWMDQLMCLCFCFFLPLCTHNQAVRNVGKVQPKAMAGMLTVRRSSK